MFISKKLKSTGQFLTIYIQKLTVISLLFVTNLLYCNEQITLGLTGVTLKEDIATIMNFKDYLAKHSNIDLNLKFAKSYSIMESFIINESVDLAYVCGSTYVNLDKLNKVELLAIPSFKNKITYSSLIISKKDKPYTKLLDLKNKTFAMSDPDSNSGSLIPIYEILKKGYNKEDFFQKVIFTYDHGESIQAVLSGFIESASVDSMVYEAYIHKNPQLEKELKIVDSFDDYPIPPFIIRKNINSDIKDKLKKALLEMNKNPKGQQILKAMSIDSLIEPKNISYDKIKDIKEFIINRESKNAK